jgi:protein-disulfide isomerase
MNPLTGADHSQGSVSAAFTLFEYGDYECPACIQAEPATAELAAEVAEAAAAQALLQRWRPPPACPAAPGLR